MIAIIEVPDSTTIEKTDILLSLLSIQQVDGGFIFNKKTAKKYNINLKRLIKFSKTIKTNLPVDHFKLLSTILVFEILKIHFSDDTDTWQAVTEKSRTWLDDLLDQEMPKIDDLDITSWAQKSVLNNVNQDEVGVLK